MQTPEWYRPPPAPTTWKEKLAYPWLAAYSFLTRVPRLMGCRLALFMCCSQMWLKGCCAYVVGYSLMPIFKSVLGQDATSLQFYTIVIAIPWSVKPIFGIISDTLRVSGYHKRYWLLFGLTSGILASGLLSVALIQRSATWLVVLFMCISFEVAIFDLLSEAVYSSLARDYAFTGNDISTWIQGNQQIGGVVAMTFMGVLSDGGYFYVIFGITAGLCCVPVIPTVFGWIGERKAPGNRIIVLDYEKLHQHRDAFLVIAFTGLAAPITAVIANAADPLIGFAAALVFSAASVVGGYFVFPRIIANFACYQLLTSLARPALGSAMDYFYTAAPDCVPGGPYFSYAYYYTYAGIVGTLASLLGVAIFFATMSTMRFRLVFILTSLFSGLAGASDLIVVTRLNIAWGIGDHWAYMVGEAVLEPVLKMLNQLPGNSLTSKVVTEGIESSVFAYLAGIANFSGMISELSGALIYGWAGIKTTPPDCNFTALPWLILACHVIGPAVSGVGLALFLIPNKKPNEKL